MSWRYASYAPRDLPTPREVSHLKFGLSSAKLSSSPGDRWSSGLSPDPRPYRNPVEPVEHSPLWAKTRVGDSPASVQRLKERYSTSEGPAREIRPYKKAETKELTGAKSGRQYGRSLTALALPEPPRDGPRLRRPPEKAPEPERPHKALYLPTATTKLFARKYSGDLPSTSASALGRNEHADGAEDTMTVVTRGTSPTPTASSVYLRSKRADFGLEKRVARSRRRVETAHKEVQTEREGALSKYGGLGEGASRPPWSGYGAASYGGSRSAGRSSYGGEGRLGVGDCRRSGSREESDGATTPESPHRSLAMKPPAPARSPPTSPAKDSDKKTSGGKSPPASVRPSLTLDCAKSEAERKPNSPTQSPSPLQRKMIPAEAPSPQAGARSPRVTIERCADIARSIEDVSSASESSEEETSSDEEPEAPVPPAMAVKKSVTNFLQNIPNHLPQAQSRASLCQKAGSLSPQWGNFQKGESGQLLSPPYLVNRQFSRDKDWLKGSWEDVGRAGGPSPKDGGAAGQGLTNGEAPAKAQRSGDCGPAAEPGEEGPCANRHPRRRECSRSPENRVAEDLSEQMKFNQQSGDYLTSFRRECGGKDSSQKLQNGLGSPPEESLLEPGDMSGLISKAKAGLAKSKTKPDIKKSSSREMSPKAADPKSEIDLYWRELADSLTRPLKLCDLDFTDLDADREADLLANSDLNGPVPPPPPMLILPVPALHPPRTSNPPTPPLHPKSRPPAPPPVPHLLKTKKTVKLFWREVKDDPLFPPTLPHDAALIWDDLPKVSVDTQKLEYLFESRAKDLISKKQQDQNKTKEVIVLDPKRSNAINIGMTKLPPPRAIKTAILKMDATVVNKEGIDKLLSMLPTEEEKLRIQEAQAANPDTPLGSAEQFLSTLASISELEARLRLWAFKLNFDNNEKEICEPLMDLKQGMEILRANTTFHGILATLLSVGNFLNGYDVKGFQIDYLSKVPEVKDTVHKHSLLHHLCLIVMDKFPDSTDLYSEIGAVTRASKVDFDELAANIRKAEEECKLSWNHLKMIAKHEGHTAMKVKMSDFLADCAERIIVVGTVHRRIMARFRKFALWLGVPANRISTTRPDEIFKTISEFALEYRTTRDRVLQQIKKINREKTRTRSHLSDTATPKTTSKEAKDDARLRQLLRNETTYPENLANAPNWRRHRKDTRNLLPETNNNDQEILDALIKTANQVPSQRLKERRRSRIYGKYCKSSPPRPTPPRSPRHTSSSLQKGCRRLQRLHLQLLTSSTSSTGCCYFVNKVSYFFYTNIIYLFTIKLKQFRSQSKVL